MKQSASIPLDTAKLAGAPALQLRKILVPFDFSGGSLEALQHAAALAAAFHADLIVLHVVHSNFSGEELGAPHTRLVNTMADHARTQLRRWVEALLPGGPLARIVIAEGCPREEIVTQAQELGVDLVVLFAHQFGGLLRLLPHTAASVIRHAPCPVLVIGARKRELLWET